VHTLLCRFSQLPGICLGTCANRQESLIANPLVVLAVACYGFAITIVRSDAS
jgi:hypothetical protein